MFIDSSFNLRYLIFKQQKQEVAFLSVVESKWHYKFSGRELQYKAQRLYKREPSLPFSPQSKTRPRGRKEFQSLTQRIVENASIKSKSGTILNCGKKNRTLLKIDIPSLLTTGSSATSYTSNTERLDPVLVHSQPLNCSQPQFFSITIMGVMLLIDCQGEHEAGMRPCI